MSIVITKEFSDWLREKLDKKGWSYREMERRSGVSYATIGNIITKPEINTYPETVRKIAKALDADEAMLLNMAGYNVPHLNLNASVPDQFMQLFNLLSEKEKADLLKYMKLRLDVQEGSGEIKGAN